MRLLLVGFSEQSVKTLKMYCQRNFSTIICDSVDRQFTDSLRLTLPTLTDEQAAYDAYMIFLGGVGITMFQPVHIKPLLKFIGKTPTILVSRKQSDRWRTKLSSYTNNVLYLDTPYSAQTIKENLDNLLNIIARTPNANHSSHERYVNTDSTSVLDDTENPKVQAQGASVPTTDSQSQQSFLTDNNDNYQDSEKECQKTYALVLKHPQTKRIDEILQTYFLSLYEQSFVRNALLIRAQTIPSKVTVGAHSLYVNAVERRAIVREDLTKLVDFVGIAGRYLFADTMSIQINRISIATYEKITQSLLQKGYKNYSLHTLIWQLAEVTLPQEFKYSEHNLKIKVMTLPNFRVMPDIPEYVYPVLATCLAKPRSIEDLEILFPNLTPMILNRLLVMALLSGILDESLLLSDENEQVTISDTGTDKQNNDASDNNHTGNSAVQKARKSGFFKRLLKKLAL